MAEIKQRRRTPKEGSMDPGSPVGIVVGKFGGLARFCEATGFATSTVWSWGQRGGLIPSRHIAAIRAAADQTRPKVSLRDRDFIPQASA